MAFAAYPPFDGTLQRYYKLYVSLFFVLRDTMLIARPADLVYKLPDSVDLVYGAMMEPLSVAVHAVANKGQCRTNMNVLIMGAGPVGLLAMGVAKGLGARTIVAVDINEERLNFAKTYAATHTYIPVSSSFLYEYLDPCHTIDKQAKPNADEPRPEYSLRAAKDLLTQCGIPARGPGSIDLVVDATGAEVCVQMGLNVVRPG
jgi:D-xylulose reductase